MTKKQIFLTTIKDNQEGVSIDHVTMKPVNTQKGYFVSITDNERVKADYRIVNALKAQAKKLNLSDYYIGYWRNERTGKHYFDISLLIQDKVKAMGIAKIFNQKAIFDSKVGEVIYC